MKNIVAYAAMNNRENMVRLNGNESYLPLSNEFVMELNSALQGIDLHRYPDSECSELKSAYASYSNISIDNIIVGNGSDEMISLVIASNIKKGKRVLTLDPDFPMFDFYTTLNQGKLIKYKCKDNGEFDLQDFIQYGRDNEVDFIIFSRPNNPTGYSLTNIDIIKILEEFPEVNVVVDEAYYEFIDETIADEINNYNNLYITRTLSKAWGLAALRIGFLISNKSNIELMKQYKTPYNVSLISQSIGTKLLQNPERVLNNVRDIKGERDKFFHELKEIERESSIEIRFYPSRANYIFGRTNYIEALIKALENKDIVIRTFNDNSFRITVGSTYENQRVIKAIKSAFVYEGELIYGEEDIQ